jgi:succinyl-CoA synthetase beta subunit
MDLMEYKAKEIFGQYSIPKMKGFVFDDIDGIKDNLNDLVFPLVVKAQVQVGGRGKAGGIKFAESTDSIQAVCKQIFGMNIKGHIVKKLLIEEKAVVGKECYLSIMLDRLSKCPMIIFSTCGGVDIEETAKKTPEKIIKVEIDPLIGISDYLTRYIISKSKLEEGLFNQLHDILKKLYRVFCEKDCLLTEINPLVITCDGKIVALDGKVSVDDSALSRQADILAFRDSLLEDELVLEARKFRFLYIPCEQDGNIGVMSNGSGMIMSCIDLISKKGMKVGAALDLGGGATAERIAEAVRIILSNSDIKALLISIFGGITRCDEVAEGVKQALEKQKLEKFVVIKVEGTNKEKGVEIIKNIKGNIISVDSIMDGVKQLDLKKGLL